MLCNPQRVVTDKEINLHRFIKIKGLKQLQIKDITQ